MSDKTILSVVVVTWNSYKEICKCIESVSASAKGINYEIIVVDNNSSDKTSDLVKGLVQKNSKIRFIQNTENKGYTKACNQGMEIAAGENIFLLNPDTVLQGSCIEQLIRKLNEDIETGAVAPQLLNPDITIQFSCRTFPEYRDMFFEMILLSSIFGKSRVFSRWKMNYFSHNEEREVDQPMAAALMIKKDVLDETGNFDGRFSMFYNDVDLCKKFMTKDIR
ncbi:MAG: glycosyltransferase family 2 protein [Ignavibacteria bacterium]|nr:glycosyltransferase family 2 protein [Ignavibacteria bacterium]